MPNKVLITSLLVTQWLFTTTGASAQPTAQRSDDDGQKEQGAEDQQEHRGLSANAASGAR